MSCFPLFSFLLVIRGTIGLNTNNLVRGMIPQTFVITYEGSTVNLTCNSDSFVIWKKLGRTIDREYIQQGRNLIMYNVNVQDTGRYICIGTYMDKKNMMSRKLFRDYADVYIGVRNDSFILREESSDSTETLNNIVQFNCTAKSGTIVWLHKSLDSKPIGYENTLTIKTSLYNTGYYICFGYDENKRHHVLAITLIRKYVPNRIHPSNNVRKVGGELELFCLTSTPAIWMHNKHTISRPNVLQRNSNALLITKIKVLNKGMYTCYGTTSKGYHFYSVSTLRVMSFDRLIIDPTNIVANIGDTVKFFCESNTQVQWKVPNQKILSSNMVPFLTESGHIFGLEITNVTKRDAGQYWCLSENDNLISADFGTLKTTGPLIALKRKMEEAGQKINDNLHQYIEDLRRSK